MTNIETTTPGVNNSVDSPTKTIKKWVIGKLQPVEVVVNENDDGGDNDSYANDRHVSRTSSTIMMKGGSSMNPPKLSRNTSAPVIGSKYDSQSPTKSLSNKEVPSSTTIERMGSIGKDDKKNASRNDLYADDSSDEENVARTHRRSSTSSTKPIHSESKTTKSKTKKKETIDNDDDDEKKEKKKEKKKSKKKNKDEDDDDTEKDEKKKKKKKDKDEKKKKSDDEEKKSKKSKKKDDEVSDAVSSKETKTKENVSSSKDDDETIRKSKDVMKRSEIVVAKEAPDSTTATVTQKLPSSPIKSKSYIASPSSPRKVPPATSNSFVSSPTKASAASATSSKFTTPSSTPSSSLVSSSPTKTSSSSSTTTTVAAATPTKFASPPGPTRKQSIITPKNNLKSPTTSYTPTRSRTTPIPEPDSDDDSDDEKVSSNKSKSSSTANKLQSKSSFNDVGTKKPVAHTDYLALQKKLDNLSNKDRDVIRKCQEIQRKINDIEHDKIEQIEAIAIDLQKKQQQFDQQALSRHYKNYSEQNDKNTTLLNENRATIQQLRTENSSIRTKNKDLCNQIATMKINKERLIESNTATDNYLNQVNYHKKSCEDDNKKLNYTIDKYKDAIELMENKYNEINSYYLCENTIKNIYKKLITAIVTILEEDVECDSLKKNEDLLDEIYELMEPLSSLQETKDDNNDDDDDD